MAASEQMELSGDVQDMEQLQARYRQLHNRQIEAKTNFKNAERQLSDLRKEAVEKYGTDNLDELRDKLAKMKAENEAKRKSYQASLDKIESDLAEVEREFAATEAEFYAEKRK